MDPRDALSSMSDSLAERTGNGERGDPTIVGPKKELAKRAGIPPVLVNLELDMRGLDRILVNDARRLDVWMPDEAHGAPLHRAHLLDGQTAAALKAAHDFLHLAIQAVRKVSNDLEDARLRAERKAGGR